MNTLRRRRHGPTVFGSGLSALVVATCVSFSTPFALVSSSQDRVRSSRTIQFTNLTPVDLSPIKVQAGTSITAKSVTRSNIPVGRTLNVSGQCNKWGRECKWWTFNLWCTDVESVRDVQSTKHLEADALNHVDALFAFAASGSSAIVPIVFSADGDTFVAPSDGSIAVQSLRPAPGYFSDEQASAVTTDDQQHAATVLAGDCAGHQMAAKGSPGVKASTSKPSLLGQSSMQLLMVSPR